MIDARKWRHSFPGNEWRALYANVSMSSSSSSLSHCSPFERPEVVAKVARLARAQTSAQNND